MKIRKMEYDGQVWFMAADICSAIGLTNPTITAKNITSENHRKLVWDVSQGKKDRESFNISGVRELLDKSRKPVDEFREWFEKWVAGGMVDTETFGEEKCENPAAKTAEKCESAAEKVESVKVESGATIFNNAEFGTVRVVMVDREPWFVGKDVAVALGYGNTRKAIADHVEDEDKLQNDGVTVCDSMGREQHPVVINESGLYSLVLSSKLESARRFKHWITSEVLPSIRKEKAQSQNRRDEMSNIEIFQNEEFGEIRTIEADGKVLFCAIDIARSLGYKNERDAISSYCRCVVKRDVPHPQNPNKVIEMSFIPEGDVYRLITHSKLPAAEKFESWVFDEVLPSIRKDGMYATEDTLQKMINNPEMIVVMAQKLLDEKHRADSECERANIAETKVAELETSVSTLQAENDALIGEITMWELRALLNAIVRKYAAVELDGDFQKAWRMLYKELLYRKGILVNGRANKGSKLSAMTDEEVNETIGVAVAMCRKKNVDVEDLMVHTAVIA